MFRDPTQVSAARLLVEEARSAGPLSSPLPQYRWEDFAEGPALRLTVRAGRDVIREPGTRYSPLVVTGGSGSGKSHFLHGLGNALVARGLGPVVCLAGPAFAAEVRSLPDATAAGEWRSRFSWVGAFLLDDLHLLAGEGRAQQELALLLAELGEGQRQVIVSSLRDLFAEDGAALPPNGCREIDLETGGGDSLKACFDPQKPTRASVLLRHPIEGGAVEVITIFKLTRK